MVILIYIFLLSGFCALIAFCFITCLRKWFQVRAFYTRKIYHIIIFTLAYLFQFHGGIVAVLVFGVMVFLQIIFVKLFVKSSTFNKALERGNNTVEKHHFLFVPLLWTALGGVVSNLISVKFAPIGYLVVGWGDAFAALVGKRWGKHLYDIKFFAMQSETKSLEGSLANFLVSFSVIVLSLCFFNIPFLSVVYIGLITAFSAAVIEAMSVFDSDNFTMQVVVVLCLRVMLGS